MKPQIPKHKNIYSAEQKAYFLNIANQVRAVREAATQKTQPVNPAMEVSK
jgi:hypothetical protein